MNTPKNNNGISTRTWLTVIGIVLSLLFATAGSVAYNFNTFASKSKVECIEEDVKELVLNMRLMVERQGAAWVEVK